MSENKTIWVLNQFAGKSDSGWGERHYFFAKYWIKKGYNVVICSASYSHMFKNQPQTDGSRFTLEKLEENITYCWVRIPEYKGDGTITKLWAGIVFSFNLLFLKKELLPKPEYIIVSSPPIFTGVSGWVLKKRFNAKKYIFEVRDLWPLSPMFLLGYSKWHPVIFGLSLFEKFAYKKADHIVSLLSNANEYIIKFTKSDKFKWIPNGIDESLIDKKNLDEKLMTLIPKNKFIITYTGTLGFANAMEYFIEATHLIKNEKIFFLLVGDGYKVEDLKSKSNPKNTLFIPKIPKSQVQSILSLSNVCYVGRFKTPLYRLGVSYNKYFDYMLASKPILESSELINDTVEQSGCGIIVEPDNAQAIADGIEKLFNMALDEREKLGKKGYDFVKKYHNFDYLSDLYIEVFNS